MVFNKLVPLCILMFLVFGTVVRCEPKLKLLHVVFRHGEKVPHKEFQNYPNDPYVNKSFYPIGSGGLTNEGKMREYKIGEKLRQWYGDYFGPVYSPDEIYATSTDIPRAQMSLQLVLAALFPPVGQQIWNEKLPWQPITTVVVPSEKDYIFFPQNCPLYKVEYRNFLAKEETRSLTDKHKATLDYLTKHTGKQINDAGAVYYLYSLFKEEKMQNLTLPDWTSKVYPYPMENITILDFDLKSYTTKLKRLGGGIMLRKITEDMKNLCNKRPETRGTKASFFSGHEGNVARLSRTLGIKELKLPEYGSTIIIETLQDDKRKEDYFVRVIVWTGLSEKKIISIIPGCEELCPLDKFLGILKDVIPDEYESNCCVESKDPKKSYAPNLTFSKYSIWLAASLPIILGQMN